jgi:Raf kinase inhibitor-like YbhB/YbcL family protein
MSLHINIPQWTDPIPTKYACLKYGKNISPKISWRPIEGTKAYALILQDLSAHNYIHWYIPSIHPSLTTIEELSTPKDQFITLNQLPAFYLKNIDIPLKQGMNHTGTYGYFGPCPPPSTGKHQYVFYLFALNKDPFVSCLKNQTKSIQLFKQKTRDEFIQYMNELGIDIISEESVSGYFDSSHIKVKKNKNNLLSL